MDDSIGLPDMEEIETWLRERCYLEQARLRNELAFLQGDRAHGGPPREDLAAALKFRLVAIARRLDSIREVSAGVRGGCSAVSSKA
ncbi:MAG TPA: hypothetical protein VJ728_07790 [Candidatus Binataceae bacterium]|nr:hypothetical protein [Candidatus Binataceae bacterium]